MFCLGKSMCLKHYETCGHTLSNGGLNGCAVRIKTNPCAIGLEWDVLGTSQIDADSTSVCSTSSGVCGSPIAESPVKTGTGSSGVFGIRGSDGSSDLTIVGVAHSHCSARKSFRAASCFGQAVVVGASRALGFVWLGQIIQRVETRFGGCFTSTAETRDSCLKTLK